MKKGFSLVEVLVFVTILSLFFVAALAVVTFSLRNMKTSQYKILASHYAEEGMEWVKGQKENDWVTFTGHDILEGTATYCINSLNFDTAAGCETNYDLGTPAIFKREVLLKNIPDTITPDQVDATVEVYWQDVGTSEAKVSLSTVLKRLE